MIKLFTISNNRTRNKKFSLLSLLPFRWWNKQWTMSIVQIIEIELFKCFFKIVGNRVFFVQRDRTTFFLKAIFHKLGDKKTKYYHHWNFLLKLNGIVAFIVFCDCFQNKKRKDDEKPVSWWTFWWNRRT